MQILTISNFSEWLDSPSTRRCRVSLLHVSIRMSMCFASSVNNGILEKALQLKNSLKMKLQQRTIESLPKISYPIPHDKVLKYYFYSRREGNLWGQSECWCWSHSHLAQGQQGSWWQVGWQSQDHQQGRSLLPGAQQLLPRRLWKLHMQVVIRGT